MSIPSPCIVALPMLLMTTLPRTRRPILRHRSQRTLPRIRRHRRSPTPCSPTRRRRRRSVARRERMPLRRELRVRVSGERSWIASSAISNACARPSSAVTARYSGRACVCVCHRARLAASANCTPVFGRHFRFALRSVVRGGASGTDVKLRGRSLRNDAEGERSTPAPRTPRIRGW